MATEPCIVQSCARAGEGEDANAASANTANADDERIRPASVDARARRRLRRRRDRDVGQIVVVVVIGARAALSAPVHESFKITTDDAVERTRRRRYRGDSEADEFGSYVSRVFHSSRPVVSLSRAPLAPASPHVSR